MRSTSIPAVWEKGGTNKKEGAAGSPVPGPLLFRTPIGAGVCRAPTKHRYWGVARKDLGAAVPPLGWAMVDPDGADLPLEGPDGPD